MLSDKNEEMSTGGGRYLLEIDAIPDLSHLEYRILMRFAQGLNFKGNFREWRYIHHETMATWIGSSRIEINKRLKEIQKDGWLESRTSTVEECEKFNIDYRTLFYRLTEKVFKNYREYLSKNLSVKNTHRYVRKTHSSECEKHTYDECEKHTLSSPSLSSPNELPHVCEEKTDTHTFNDVKKKEKCLENRLSGIFGDFVKKFTKEKFITFEVSQKNVDSIFKQFPDLTAQIFFDEFCKFQSLSNLHQFMNINNVTLDIAERGFSKFLKEKKYNCLEERKTITEQPKKEETYAEQQARIRE